MKRVLVTGAAGFIGRHCLPRLVADGYEVHAVSSGAMGEEAGGIVWRRADLLDERATSALVAEVRPTHLLHLAWYTVPGRYWAAPENFRWVRASLALVEAFAASGGERLVVAGTCAEYDWRYGYCVEGVTPLAPATTYGVCKDALRALVEEYARGVGLSAAWGRIFFLYGPCEHPDRLVSSVIRSLLRGEAALCSHGEQIRDFLYVEDVAAAFVALLGSEVAGAVNIASGKPLALKEIILAIAEHLGEQGLVRLGARPTAADEPPLLLADVGRLRGAVGWSPQHGLDEGLGRTIAFWRDAASVG